MKKLHELTALLWDEAQQSAWHGMAERDDRTIRHWLKKRSDEIKESYGLGWGAQKAGKKYITEILGLTDEGEKKTIMICSQHLTEDCELCGSSKKTPQKQSWCEHTNINKNNAIECFKDSMHWYAADKWQFCPICGTPRPTPKPLVQRLAEKLNEPLLTPYGQAQIAIDFLREHKGEL